ncbi:MAG: alpha/beta hydrolase domain-containing protein [Verrucomicrobia bacterium]|nr:alpha/beta hydrolase domain-containing protein [Verrucomicrobiota bacterium]
MALLTAILIPVASARVVRIELTSRQPILEGKSFGLAGSYEKLAGELHFAVNPKNPANRVIADIDKAPTNDQGDVEFSSDFFMIQPANPDRGNKTVLYEVSNRGGKGMLGFFNFASGSLNPEEETHFGDGFLLREGYTLLWIGWQFDPPPRDGLMRLHAPVATDNGNPIRGLVRSDFVVADREEFHSLADRSHIPYAVADPNAPGTQLTVRDSAEAKPRLIPRSEWKFARAENGKPVTDTGHVFLEGGFVPGRIYEVVYLSENPTLVGLGSAAVRDAVSYLKYGGRENNTIPGGRLERAIGFGISQSGRFLRTFLYYGFNEDESRRNVFDGMLSHVAGGGRGSFNHRFAQPSRDAHPFMNFFYPTDIFPFTDNEQLDPETGISDGLMKRQKPEFRPKIFYTNSSYEYWGRAASLIHTSVDGERDAAIPSSSRIYLFSGSQHGPSGFPPARSIGEQLNNPMDFRWSMRALLSAMNRWCHDDATPPASRYPRIDDGTLVSPDNLGFPNIPGVRFSSRLHKAYRVDYGPEFRLNGIVTLEPPRIGSAFPMKVPAVDPDGNEVAGVKMPEMFVPLATYTGWNLFHSRSGPTNEISSMAGSYIPFPVSETERAVRNDPRQSISARHQSKTEYLGRIATAAMDLIGDRLLLAEDMPAIMRNAARHWDYRVTTASK